jgi:hypothetical protein
LLGLAHRSNFAYRTVEKSLLGNICGRQLFDRRHPRVHVIASRDCRTFPRTRRSVVKVRALLPIAAAAGFWLSGPAIAQQPAQQATVTNSNQKLAETIVSRLRAGKVGDGADIAIVAQNGTVTLTGTTKDSSQKERIILSVRETTGVFLVRDGLKVGGIIQAQGPELAQAPLPIPPMGPPPGAVIVEPAPLGIPGQFSPDMQAPNLPPYAWPTYAPYNNLSRVGYPTQYPYNAFPFIGPYYPFPKVPLGWRKVTLEWEDGYWFIGRNSTPHDYWRVKFW